MECIENLRVIDAAKQTWAMVLKDPITNAVPTWKDVLPYMQNVTRIWQNGGGPPKCPSGGTYKLGRVAEPPTCSVPGHVLD